MSRKHNCKHNRKRSNYPLRLLKRGLTSRSVRMADLPTLRKRQGFETVTEMEKALRLVAHNA